MSQIGRALEAPRPLKSTIKQQSLPIYHQNIEIKSSKLHNFYQSCQHLKRQLH